MPKKFDPNSIPFLDMYLHCKLKPGIAAKADDIIHRLLLQNQRRYQEIALLVREEKNRPSMYRWPLFPSTSIGNPVEDRIKRNRSLHGLPETPPEPENNHSSLSFRPKRRMHGMPMTSFDTLGALIPWYFIALVHYRESDCDFTRHLHNGDSLKRFTRKIPQNRPTVMHGPPFGFEESAVDAMIYQGRKDGWNDHWALKNILIRLEMYNGFGYEMYHGVNSPYLWGGSEYYSRGQYVELAKNNYKTSWENTPSSQIGTAILLKRMEEIGKISVLKS